jgi:glycosyltransferase involved in cell wall biosynthesis
VKPGENGYVFPAGDAQALAAILREVLPDAGKMARMGRAAKRRMEAWSPREYTNAMVRAVEMATTNDAGINL